MIETPEQTHRKAERDNKDYKKIFTSDVAEHLREAGFSIISIKTLYWFVGIVGGLLIIIYGTLVATDAQARIDEKSDITAAGLRLSSLESQHSLFEKNMANVASNIYNVCKTYPNAKCVNPEGPLK